MDLRVVRDNGRPTKRPRILAGPRPGATSICVRYATAASLHGPRGRRRYAIPRGRVGGTSGGSRTWTWLDLRKGRGPCQSPPEGDRHCLPTLAPKSSSTKGHEGRYAPHEGQDHCLVCRLRPCVAYVRPPSGLLATSGTVRGLPLGVPSCSPKGLRGQRGTVMTPLPQVGSRRGARFARVPRVAPATIQPTFGVCCAPRREEPQSAPRMTYAIFTSRSSRREW